MRSGGACSVRALPWPAWCLPSCNDDKIGDISLIYGRWEATSFSGYEKEEGEEPYEWNYGPSEMAGDYVIFNTDGT